MRFLWTCIILSILVTPSAYSASLFHSYVTDLSPPYMCKLKLKNATGVSIDTNHTYQFSGICSIKLPVGNSWIYQNVWVDTQAQWNGLTNDAVETTTLANNMGTIVAQLKCDDDPWITKGQCALLGYQNDTQYTNLGGVYNARTGQYPPFEIITGQYPPLARNQAILREAIVLSILSARQEAAAAHAAFNQTFGQAKVTQIQRTTSTTRVTTPAAQTRKVICQVFRKPMVGKYRLDACLKLNKDCGKPAADAFCRSKGFRQARNCQIDNKPTLPTFIIGTRSTCVQSFCKGFEMVECIK